MARTQICLDHELRQKARRRAAQLGVSFAEYVRRVVERDLEEPRARRDPSILFGLGESAGADVARDKDAMLGLAVAPRRGRRPPR